MTISTNNFFEQKNVFNTEKQYQPSTFVASFPSFDFVFKDFDFAGWTLPKIDFSNLFSFNFDKNLGNCYFKQFSPSFNIDLTSGSIFNTSYNSIPSYSNFDTFSLTSTKKGVGLVSSPSIEVQPERTISTSSGVAKEYHKGDIWRGHRISSLFGKRKAPTAGASTNHKGVDLSYALNEDVYAFAAGTVVNVVTGHKGYGNYVDIKSADGVIHRYAHNNRILVNVGDKVSESTVIALAGSTGISTGPHVHYEVMVNGANVNPLSYSSLA